MKLRGDEVDVLGQQHQPELQRAVLGVVAAHEFLLRLPGGRTAAGCTSA